MRLLAVQTHHVESCLKMYSATTVIVVIANEATTRCTNKYIGPCCLDSKKRENYI